VTDPGSTSPGPPRRGTPRSRAIATRVLALFGWRVAGPFPTAPRAVVIVAPHTSNWDFPVSMTAMLALGLRIDFFAKHSLFFFPARYVLRWLGAKPVDRQVRSGTVRHSIERLASEPELYVGIAPEGTRKRVEAWKTGFWQVADGAGVPIIPVALDWGRRELRIMDAVETTGDQAADIAAIQKMFQPEMARRPENFAGA
jgi:1-acyl-sn-glycerol-3-phosphate acyltransferase